MWLLLQRMLSFSLSDAEQWDAKDPLNKYRDQFHVPKVNGEESIYLCGNSLGLMPKTAKKYLEQDFNDWAELGVEGHFKGQSPWFHYHKFLTEQTSRLVGALPLEVVVMNQLSVNLHLLLTSFYKPNKQRFKIVMEAGAFPSDMYVIETQLGLNNISLADGLIEISPRTGEHSLRQEDIEQVLEEHKEDIALVFFSGVQYYTGQTFDIEKITKKAHEIGAVCGFDLAHAAGNIPLKLHEWGVDFAAWCSYKYLNSGPGNVSGVFIHEKNFNTYPMRLAGWWGHKEDVRFEMKKGFIPEPGAAGWQLSNAPVFGMAVHRASLDLFDEVGMALLSKKSNALTQMMRKLLTEVLSIQNSDLFQIITPVNEAGAQLSLLTNNSGKKLFEHLEKNGVICDWREPNVIRMAAVPFYNSMTDVVRLAQAFLSFK